MKLKEQLVNQMSPQKAYINFEEENKCPICKKILSPEFISASLNTNSTASVFNFCLSCNNTFITNYSVYAIESYDYNSLEFDSDYLSSEPNQFKKKVFDDKIISISPQFDKIYNQALAAESSGLDEIAGLGYRKSLEFLVKDFAIHKHPEKAEDIKSKMLSPCVREYIDDTRIKTLAERSAWIGNDEAHYIRKQGNLDINDMKAFIEATVYFISMVLITDKASNIAPAK